MPDPTFFIKFLHCPVHLHSDDYSEVMFYRKSCYIPLPWHLCTCSLCFHCDGLVSLTLWARWHPSCQPPETLSSLSTFQNKTIKVTWLMKSPALVHPHYFHGLRSGMRFMWCFRLLIFKIHHSSDTLQLSGSLAEMDLAPSYCSLESLKHQTGSMPNNNTVRWCRCKADFLQ